jgi:hypothetical protein
VQKFEDHNKKETALFRRMKRPAPGVFCLEEKKFRLQGHVAVNEAGSIQS